VERPVPSRIPLGVSFTVDMTVRLIVTFSILMSFQAFCQKPVLFVLDTLPTRDAVFNHALSNYRIEFRHGTIHDLTTYNFRVLDSLNNSDKTWYKDLDKSLLKNDSWEKMKNLNTGKHFFKSDTQYYEIVFWDFCRIKHYKIDDWTGAEHRHVLTISGDYTRSGKKTNK
jgi:hypothetical protein